MKSDKIITPGKVFLLGFLMYLACVLPFIIWHGGIFFYFGDYNVQQVPFYMLAHHAVREGRIFWNPYIDLGGSMAGSFSFYLWGSPFFWLTVPFPDAWVPYLMPVVMGLKYGTAMAASYVWIRRQTRTDRAALIGALLYSFSGFQACNIVFQHFHDATAFFPLYLLTFDDLVTSKQKRRIPAFVPFVLMTAFMAILNYYFFAGQVVFFLLYFLFRYAWAKPVKESLLSFLQVLGCGLLGVGIAAFFLVQSLSGLFGNTRLSERLSGVGLVLYPNWRTPLAIVKSVFMIPDLIARGTLFANDDIKVSSLAAYLPCLCIAGVIAYCFRRKKDWKKRMLVFFLVCAFVPALNAMFSAFNVEYYARWYYFPILLCAAASAEALDEPDSKAVSNAWGIGLDVTALGLLFCVLCAILPVRQDGALVFGGLLTNNTQFWTNAGVTAAMLPGLFYIVYWAGKEPKPANGRRMSTVASASKKVTSKSAPSRRVGTASGGKAAAANSVRNIAAAAKADTPVSARTRATKVTLVIVIASCMLSTMTVLLGGNSLIAKSGGRKWRQQMLEWRPELPEEDEFCRVETGSTSTNYEMVWRMPTIHCFESTVTPSIFRLFEGIGMRRTVESTLPYYRIGIRQILSMRYELFNTYVKGDKYDPADGLPSYALSAQSCGYDIYENGHFIPMGFTFDSYLTESQYDALEKNDHADRLLVKDIILPDEMAEELAAGTAAGAGSTQEGEGTATAAGSDSADALSGEVISLVNDTEALSDTTAMSLDTFYALSDARAASACTEFAFDRDGFRAVTSDLPAANYVFFSVPWDRGWTVTVDGQEAEIVCADYGLMAVAVPSGVHEISFRWRPYGLGAGIAVSLVSLGILVLLIFAAGRQSADGKNSAGPVIHAWEEFIMRL